MQTLSLSRLRGARRAPSLLSRLWTAREIAKQRKSLAQLDDAILQDIGLTREQATSEAHRPAWDVPCHWMK